MKIIWYNPDQNEYKCGGAEEFNNDLMDTQNKEAFTILMKFDKGSKNLAQKVMKQLNVISNATKSSFVL